VWSVAGDTNAEFRRYHRRLVGNKPGFIRLDCQLFFDLADNNDRNIVLTSSRPMGPKNDPCKSMAATACGQPHMSLTLFASHGASTPLVSALWETSAAFLSPLSKPSLIRAARCQRKRFTKEGTYPHEAQGSVG